MLEYTTHRVLCIFGTLFSRVADYTYGLFHIYIPGHTPKGVTLNWDVKKPGKSYRHSPVSKTVLIPASQAFPIASGSWRGMV